MKTSLARLIALSFFLLPVTMISAPKAPALSEDDRAALEIGNAIIAVDKALEYELPENPRSVDLAKSALLTDAMVKAGQITRLYPWVSARIGQEINLAQDRLRDTHPDAAQTHKLNKRIEYLQHVKLLIDAPL